MPTWQDKSFLWYIHGLFHVSPSTALSLVIPKAADNSRAVIGPRRLNFSTVVHVLKQILPSTYNRARTSQIRHENKRPYRRRRLEVCDPLRRAPASSRAASSCPLRERLCIYGASSAAARGGHPDSSQPLCAKANAAPMSTAVRHHSSGCDGHRCG
jgi:hypothetical protein